MSGNQIGFILGAAVGILLLVIYGMAQKKGKKKGWCDFDERQLWARGRAFQYGFLTLVIYDILYGVIYMEDAPTWCDNFFGNFIGVALAITVFGTCAIWNDAFMNLNQRPLVVCIFFGGIGLLNLVGACRYIMEGELIVDGKIGMGGINLSCGIVLLLLTIMFCVKQLRDRRETE